MKTKKLKISKDSYRQLSSFFDKNQKNMNKWVSKLIIGHLPRPNLKSEIEIPQTEIISNIIEQAMKSYKDGRTPDNMMKSRLTSELYNELFSYRDNKEERPLDRAVEYSLQEIFAELKFGRPVNSQKYLEKCIQELNEE